MTRSNLLSSQEGKAGGVGTLDVRFLVDGDMGFAMLQKSMAPRALAAPLHRHAQEDEYTYVLEGRIGALLGDDVVIAEAGDLMFRPRNQWHTFWNAGDKPAKSLEIVSPSGLEGFFHELADFTSPPPPESEEYAELCARYKLEIQPDSIPLLVERFDLRFPGNGT
jgi:quercetin dioxygenase-like cupin family protein